MKMFKKEKMPEGLLEIDYYLLEESSSKKGYGLNPGDVVRFSSILKEDFKRNEIFESTYLIRGSLIKFLYKGDYSLKSFNADIGSLCFTIIGSSSKNLEETAKFFNLPFTKKAIKKYFKGQTDL